MVDVVGGVVGEVVGGEEVEGVGGLAGAVTWGFGRRRGLPSSNQGMSVRCSPVAG